MKTICFDGQSGFGKSTLIKKLTTDYSDLDVIVVDSNRSFFSKLNNTDSMFGSSMNLLSRIMIYVKNDLNNHNRIIDRSIIGDLTNLVLTHSINYMFINKDNPKYSKEDLKQVSSRYTQGVILSISDIIKEIDFSDYMFVYIREPLNPDYKNTEFGDHFKFHYSHLISRIQKYNESTYHNMSDNEIIKLIMDQYEDIFINICKYLKLNLLLLGLDNYHDFTSETFTNFMLSYN